MGDRKKHRKGVSVKWQSGSFTFGFWLRCRLMGSVTKFVSSNNTLFALWQFKFTTYNGFTKQLLIAGGKNTKLNSPGREFNWWRAFDGYDRFALCWLTRLIDLVDEFNIAWWLFILLARGFSGFTQLSTFAKSTSRYIKIYFSPRGATPTTCHREAIVCLAMAWQNTKFFLCSSLLWIFPFSFFPFTEIFSLFFPFANSLSLSLPARQTPPSRIAARAIPWSVEKCVSCVSVTVSGKGNEICRRKHWGDACLQRAFLPVERRRRVFRFEGWRRGLTRELSPSTERKTTFERERRKIGE